jgi:hypothetical protein
MCCFSHERWKGGQEKIFGKDFTVLNLAPVFQDHGLKKAYNPSFAPVCEYMWLPLNTLFTHL